jgi:hypothetical protein
VACGAAYENRFITDMITSFSLVSCHGKVVVVTFVSRELLAPMSLKSPWDKHLVLMLHSLLLLLLRLVALLFVACGG